MENKRILFWLVLLLGGCTTAPEKQAAIVPVEERSVPVEIKPVKPESVVRKEPVQEQSPVHSGANEPGIQQQKTDSPAPGPAVIALLAEAEDYAREGRGEQASASVERALRIEPGNAVLWNRLALIRLQQGQWEQVLALAGKSNALSGKDYQLQSSNWELIARAYEALGQPGMAKKAREKSENLMGKG